MDISLLTGKRSVKPQETLAFDAELHLPLFFVEILEADFTSIFSALDSPTNINLFVECIFSYVKAALNVKSSNVRVKELLFLFCEKFVASFPVIEDEAVWREIVRTSYATNKEIENHVLHPIDALLRAFFDVCVASATFQTPLSLEERFVRATIVLAKFARLHAAFVDAQTHHNFVACVVAMARTWRTDSQASFAAVLCEVAMRLFGEETSSANRLQQLPSLMHFNAESHARIETQEKCSGSSSSFTPLRTNIERLVNAVVTSLDDLQTAAESPDWLCVFPLPKCVLRLLAKQETLLERYVSWLVASHTEQNASLVVHFLAQLCLFVAGDAQISASEKASFHVCFWRQVLANRASSAFFLFAAAKLIEMQALDANSIDLLAGLAEEAVIDCSCTEWRLQVSLFLFKTLRLRSKGTRRTAPPEAFAVATAKETLSHVAANRTADVRLRGELIFRTSNTCSSVSQAEAVRNLALRFDFYFSVLFATNSEFRACSDSLQTPRLRLSLCFSACGTT